MLDEMTWEQFVGWVAFAEVDPFGEERADLRSGIIAQTIANVNRDPRKGRPYKASDFMPKFRGSGPSSVSRGPIKTQAQWQGITAMARAVYEVE